MSLNPAQHTLGQLYTAMSAVDNVSKRPHTCLFCANSQVGGLSGRGSAKSGGVWWVCVRTPPPPPTPRTRLARVATSLQVPRWT